MRHALEAALRLPRGLHAERVQWLYEGHALPPSASTSSSPHVLYWMQTSVRAKYNYSLEWAVAAAHALCLPLHIVYLLRDHSDQEGSLASARDPNASGVATERHAVFALQGLACVAQRLTARGLSFQVLHAPQGVEKRQRQRQDGNCTAESNRLVFHDDPGQEVPQPLGQTPTPTQTQVRREWQLLQGYAAQAALVVTDRPYLRPWRSALDDCATRASAQRVPWALVQVEGEVVVPCEVASKKEEYAARTLRPRHTAHWPRFLVELEHVTVANGSRTATSAPLTPPSPASASASTSASAIDPDPEAEAHPEAEMPPLQLIDLSQPLESLLARLRVDRTVRRVEGVLGGEPHASRLAKRFVSTRLARFAQDRNEPSAEACSQLSMYLRHGHISAVRLALSVNRAVRAAGKGSALRTKLATGRDSFLEELLVRRELSVNMCVFNGDRYDSMECLPAYARETLRVHAPDQRPYVYSAEQLEKGETRDPYWNAAQRELRRTGDMHGYLRMYWAKKVLEWTETPERGFALALYLNNKYALDAPDPNSYTGIAWSFGKHDQGWKERPIFGKVRYMNEAGLKRKFRMQLYVDKVNRLPEPSRVGAQERATDALVDADEQCEVEDAEEEGDDDEGEGEGEGGHEDDEVDAESDDHEDIRKPAPSAAKTTRKRKSRHE